MSTGKTKIRPKMLFDYESVTEDDGIYTFVNCLVLDATIGLPLGSEIFRLVYDSYDKTIQVGYDVINQKQLYNVELINMMEEGEKKLFLVSKFRTFMIEGAGDEKIFTLASLESMRTKIVVHELEQVEREGTYDLVSVLKGINLKKLRASGKAEIKALPHYPLVNSQFEERLETKPIDTSLAVLLHMKAVALRNAMRQLCSN